MNTNTIKKGFSSVLLLSVFIIATCGILYELLLSSISSYFLGNSILQFSLTIGLFMFFMGIGSYLSKFIENRLIEKFVNIEIFLGLIGGISATVLYSVYSFTRFYYLYYFLFIAILGVLVGVEIPIVVRIINRNSTLKDTVAEVLSFDYVGALVASLVFPLVLLPKMGLVNTALFIGILNLAIAAGNAWFFRDLLRRWVAQMAVSIGLIALFVVGMIYSPVINNQLEQKVFQDKIIFKKQTLYQNIVLTKWNDDYRMFINGSIQFSSTDEYRYHESLVHLPMSMAGSHENVLILGGGDGMTLREVLRYDDIGKVQLVDLDPEVTKLARENDIFKKLNDNSFSDPRVTIINADAFKFIENSSEVYSVIIIDLPDPNNTGLGKLYTKEFYNIVANRLAKDGYLVTQATSPYFAPKSYWCINNTISASFGETIPYHAHVPTFGIWGFVMASNSVRVDSTGIIDKNFVAERVSSRMNDYGIMPKMRFLNKGKIPSMLTFEKDMQAIPTDTNRLNSQVLLEYYNSSADNWR